MPKQGLRLYGKEVDDAARLLHLAQDIRGQAHELGESCIGSTDIRKEANIFNGLEITAENNNICVKSDGSNTVVEMKTNRDNYFPPMNSVFHFKIPNTKEGKNWLEQMKKYLNTDTYGIRQRGRGKRENRSEWCDLPIEKAVEIAIYLYYKESGE
jgi:hypothetical protein